MHTLNGGLCRCEGLGVSGAAMPLVGLSPTEAERGQCLWQCSVGTALPADVKSLIDATRWALPPAWMGFSLGADASKKMNPPWDGIFHRERVVCHCLVVPIGFMLNAV